MSIKAESFLALEASLTLRLRTTLDDLTGRVFAAVQRAMDAGDWGQASREMQALDLAPVFDLNTGYIAYVSRLAVLFGASRVTPTPGTSSVGLGYEKGLVAQAVESLRQALVVVGQRNLIAAGLQLIAMNRDRQDAPVAVAKAAKPYVPPVLPFASFMDAQGKAVMNLASSLHTSRLSAFGYTAEANYLGVTEYQINEQLDGRTCLVCRMMHGKVFKVQDARNLLDLVVRTQNPDELKSLQPWPSQT